MEAGIGFASGFVYGATSVVVGQPLELVKTLKQSSQARMTYSQIVKDIVKADGMKGLYRGSLAPLIGGSFFRSAQFGCYTNVMHFLKTNTEDQKFFGFLSWHVVAAGAAGGLGRGVVEGVADHIKVRQMVKQRWSLHSLRTESGMGVTCFRNVNLFGSFVIYMDLSKQLTDGKMSPFWTGGLCASAAWLTIWPLDVVKSRIQSGLIDTKGGMLAVLKDVYRSGNLYAGVGPGLARGFIANGCSMFMYKKTEAFLSQRFLGEDYDAL